MFWTGAVAPPKEGHPLGGRRPGLRAIPPLRCRRVDCRRCRDIRPRTLPYPVSSTWRAAGDRLLRALGRDMRLRFVAGSVACKPYPQASAMLLRSDRTYRPSCSGFGPGGQSQRTAESKDAGLQQAFDIRAFTKRSIGRAPRWLYVFRPCVILAPVRRSIRPPSAAFPAGPSAWRCD